MQIRRVLNSNLLKKTLNIQNKSVKSFCSIDECDIPIVDIDKFLNKSQNWEKECKIAAECLHDTGIMIVKDPVI